MSYRFGIGFTFTKISRFIEPLVPGRPRNLRFTHGAGLAPNSTITASWDAPSSWGDDSLGSEARKYDTQLRELFTASGDVATGASADWHNDINDNNRTSRVFSVPTNSIWQLRVRADNMLGNESPWATIEVHVVEQDGFLLLDRRFLRLDNRRLRLT